MAIELSKYCLGFVLAMAASLALCGTAIMAKGTMEQKEKFGLPVMTMEKIGCWAITEPDSGSDAFSVKSTAKPDGEGYILNGTKTFITNAPYADIMLVYAKINRGDNNKMLHAFILERGMPGLTTAKPM